MRTTATPLVENLIFAESPRWRDDRLWFSNMHDQQVKTLDSGSPSG